MVQENDELILAQTELRDFKRTLFDSPPKNVHPLDQHYMNLRHELDNTFETIGLAA